MLQAFQAGAIDTGFIGSTPLIFAQAGKQDIVAVAGWAYTARRLRAGTAPGNSDITGWDDLKGKKVAYQQGTAGEAALLQALDNVGLKLSDVTTVNVPQTQVVGRAAGRLGRRRHLDGAADERLPRSRTRPRRRSATTSGDHRPLGLPHRQPTTRSNNAGKTAALGRLHHPAGQVVQVPAGAPGRSSPRRVYVEQYGLSSRSGGRSSPRQNGVAELRPAARRHRRRRSSSWPTCSRPPARSRPRSTWRDEFDTRFNAIVAEGAGLMTSLRRRVIAGAGRGAGPQPSRAASGGLIRARHAWTAADAGEAPLAVPARPGTPRRRRAVLRGLADRVERRLAEPRRCSPARPRCSPSAGT